MSALDFKRQRPDCSLRCEGAGAGPVAVAHARR